MDALGSNIRVDARGREVMRILPRNHDDVNEEWISDKTRHVVDGLRRQRLDRPYVRKDGKLAPVSWTEALDAAAAAMKGARVAAVAGDLAPVEAMWALKGLMDGLGQGAYDCRQDGAKLPRDNRSAGLDRAKAILIVGSNPRTESPVLNARIRKAWSLGAEIAVIGEAVDLTYPHTRLGAGPETLKGVAGSAFADKLRAGGVVILGAGAVARADGAAVLAAAMGLAAETGAAFSMLHTAASRVGGMEIGFSCDAGAAGAIAGADVVYLLGADEIDVPAGKTVIYQGHHGDRGAHRADIILPGAAYTEQMGLYVNTEGRPQMAIRAGFAPGEAREDWAILRALSEKVGAKLPFDTLAALHKQLFAAHPHLSALDSVTPAEFRAEMGGAMDPAPFANAIGDFYLTNPVARASAVMAELSRLAADRARAMAAE
jgi:NADH-quinone oxidoreductase subunit G